MTEVDINEMASRVPAVIFKLLVIPPGHRQFTFLSDAVERIYEVTPEEGYRDSKSLSMLIHPDDIGSHRASIDKAVREGAASWGHVHRIRPRSGRERWVQSQATIERLADGSTLWFGVFTDVTWCIESQQSFFRLLMSSETRLQARRQTLEKESAELDAFRNEIFAGKGKAFIGHEMDTGGKIRTGSPGRPRRSDNTASANSAPLAALSKRENDVLRLIAAGKPSKEIAKSIELSIATVSAHRRNIRRKLMVKNGADLTRYAVMKFPNEAREK